MTTPEPTAEHIDAVARVMNPATFREGHVDGPRAAAQTVIRTRTRAILTTDNPDAQAALAANLPREVMLAALVADGTLTECQNTALPGWRFYQGEVRP